VAAAVGGGGGRVELDDVQALWGGRRIAVAGPGWAVVERVRPGMRVWRYEVALGPAAWMALLRVLVENDFATIAPAERPGIPDEARPRITLVNAAQEQRSVSKWAGVQDARFEAVYQALLQVERLTEQLDPAAHGPHSAGEDLPSPVLAGSPPAASPWAGLEELRRVLEQRGGGRTPDGAQLEELLRAAAALEAVHAWAAEMQLGAEGFDNTTAARAYGELQERLTRAAHELAQAGRILQRQDSTYG
jgi:hypothetical protein